MRSLRWGGPRLKSRVPGPKLGKAEARCALKSRRDRAAVRQTQMSCWSCLRLSVLRSGARLEKSSQIRPKAYRPLDSRRAIALMRAVTTARQGSATRSRLRGWGSGSAIARPSRTRLAASRSTIRPPFEERLPTFCWADLRWTGDRPGRNGVASDDGGVSGERRAGSEVGEGFGFDPISRPAPT